ncbi:MAG: hypothetical protein M3P20_03610, partial [Thermoproteota archaeon]|nr:hypothetical protein [Thermoproteota archaeon]
MVEDDYKRRYSHICCYSVRCCIVWNIWIKREMDRARKVEKSTEAIKLERKLEIYGTLTTLLQSFHQKTQRVNLQKGTVTTASKYQHALEVPFDADKLDEIFEKARYLLSDDLIT